jgi:hypothetical protein
MADVEVVATYELYNISRTKLEKLIHRVFDSARLDIEIKDRFGQRRGGRAAPPAQGLAGRPDRVRIRRGCVPGFRLPRLSRGNRSRWESALTPSP